MAIEKSHVLDMLETGQTVTWPLNTSFTEGDEYVDKEIIGKPSTPRTQRLKDRFMNAKCKMDMAMPILYTTSSVHLRAGMSTKTKSLTTLAAGTPVILMGFTSQWAHVIVNGQTGFIYAKYLK